MNRVVSQGQGCASAEANRAYAWSGIMDTAPSKIGSFHILTDVKSPNCQ